MEAAVQGAWGAWLAGQGRHAEAISHLVAAAQGEAALQAASAARDWQAAGSILEGMVGQLPCDPHSPLRRIA